MCASCNDGSIPSVGASCAVSYCYGSMDTSYNQVAPCTCTTAVFPPGLRTLAVAALRSCPINYVNFPSTVISIGYWAFAFCPQLTSVTIPGTVTSIGNYAFYGCPALTSVTIASGVTSIGNYAFMFCPALTSVTIPGSVTNMGNGIFEGCFALTSVTIASGVTSIGDNAFFYCTALSCVSIPQTVTSIGNQAFSGDSLLTSINVPLGITSSVSSSFDCTPVSPTPSPTFLGTICSGSTTTVITSTTPNICPCPAGQYYPAVRFAPTVQRVHRQMG